MHKVSDPLGSRVFAPQMEVAYGLQDLSKEQAETHKVLVQPALELAANAAVNVLQQLIRSITEQVHLGLGQMLLAAAANACL